MRARNASRWNPGSPHSARGSQVPRRNRNSNPCPDSGSAIRICFHLRTRYLGFASDPTRRSCVFQILSSPSFDKSKKPLVQAPSAAGPSVLIRGTEPSLPNKSRRCVSGNRSVPSQSSHKVILCASATLRSNMCRKTGTNRHGGSHNRVLTFLHRTTKHRNEQKSQPDH